MRKGSLLLTAWLVMSSAAHAGWAQEPTTVFDMPLGEQVTSVNVPQCEGTGHTRVDKLSCVRDTDALADRIRTVYSTPNIGFDFTTRAYLYAGAIASISLTFNSTDFQAMEELLRERYGRPHKVTIVQAAFGSGAKLPLRTLTWTGRKVSIIAIERVEIDKANVSFISRTIAAQQQANEQAAARKNAAKF